MYEILDKISNPVGIGGVILLLIAYFALSTTRLEANSLKYQILNFFGAWLILFSLFFHWNTASVIIEIAWIAISLIGISKTIFIKNK